MEFCRTSLRHRHKSFYIKPVGNTTHPRHHKASTQAPKDHRAPHLKTAATAKLPLDFTERSRVNIITNDFSEEQSHEMLPSMDTTSDTDSNTTQAPPPPTPPTSTFEQAATSEGTFPSPPSYVSTQPGPSGSIDISDCGIPVDLESQTAPNVMSHYTPSSDADVVLQCIGGCVALPIAAIIIALGAGLAWRVFCWIISFMGYFFDLVAPATWR